MNPQQIGPAWAFVVQVFEDHHRTLSPAAAASFKAVGQQHLNALEPLVGAALAPPPVVPTPKKKRRKKRAAKPQATPAA